MLSTMLTGLAILTLAASPTSKPSSACAAAEQLLVSTLASNLSPPLLSADAAPPFRGNWKRARELRLGGWSGPAPSKGLLDRWEASAGANALRCSNVQDLARAGNDRTSPVDAETMAIGLPIIGPSGNEALAQVTTHRARLGGGVFLYLLRKSEGRWIVVSRRMLVIS